MILPGWSTVCYLLEGYQVKLTYFINLKQVQDARKYTWTTDKILVTSLPLASTLREIKVIDKFGCICFSHNHIATFHKRRPNNIAIHKLAVNRFDQDQWKKKNQSKKNNTVFFCSSRTVTAETMKNIRSRSAILYAVKFFRKVVMILQFRGAPTPQTTR